MKNYFDLTGQVAVVTGASTGLGLQMAKAFANQGAKLVLLARRMNLLEENAKAITEEFGVEVLPFACDITDTEKVKAAVAATIERFGRVDILMNNAGTGAVAPAEEITDEQFKKELEIDLYGTFVCSREFGKEMIKAGYGQARHHRQQHLPRLFLYRPDNRHPRFRFLPGNRQEQHPYGTLRQAGRT